ncbi:MAG TPA: hypothetical protein VFH31_05280 [Pyrinomonadaceae bacterium]|nr:hypothetical protein [Pyrinomonadaceae bacterium]
MSIVLFSRYRRQGLRKAWSLANMNNTVAYVSAGLLALFAAHVFVQWLDDSLEQAEDKGRQYGALEREGLERDVKALAHAMNGGAIIDAQSGDVFFFEVSRQKGL